jgi:succinate-semialdehyde dehydrogenase/glutarate-semialdehyde dehydrogenase
MVVKPAEQTPLSALAVANLLNEAGVPAGVCNVVPTSDPRDTVAALLDDPRLRKLSFTGSTETGRLLLARASSHLLRTSMELGGNAPFLVLPDADVDAAVSGAMVAKMRNMGESCVAANRFLVHESVREQFTAALTSRMAGLRVGPGIDPSSDVGPIIDAVQRGRIASLVDDARTRGAGVTLGGVAPDGPGFFYLPTVLVDTPAEAAINREEIFGPVASIRYFADTDEMFSVANDTDYGLVAYVYTRDISTALSAIELLDYGMVGINRGLVSDAAAPFGGVKHSGLGREGGREGIDEYLSLTYVAVEV